MDSDSKPHPDDFYRGLDLFNRRFYYECHDLWEEVWAEAKGKEKLFYQALIMSAVSLYHFGNENLEGALSCHRKAGERFRPAPRPLSGLRCLAIRGRDGGFLPRPVRRAYPLDPGTAKQTPPHHSIEGIEERSVRRRRHGRPAGRECLVQPVPGRRPG